MSALSDKNEKRNKFMLWNVHFAKMKFYTISVSRNVQNIQMLLLGWHGSIVMNSKRKMIFLKGQSLRYSMISILGSQFY